MTKASRKASKAPKAKLSEIRIISGKYRSRKITFLQSISDLRPTPNRVRETLFNWLSPYVYNARCLDAFAGSGALGIEALSRGALECTFIENHKLNQRYLQCSIDNLSINNANILSLDACQHIQSCSNYDIIFLDPPFQSSLLQQALDYILENHLIGTDTLIYIEYAKKQSISLLEHFNTIKSSTAGDVQFSLIQKNNFNYRLKSGMGEN